MERIFSANQPLNANNVIVVNMKCNRVSNSFLAMIGYSTQTSRYYIFSNRSRMDDSRPEIELFDALPMQCSYSWKSEIANEGLPLTDIWALFSDIAVTSYEVLDNGYIPEHANLGVDSYISESYTSDNLYSGQSGYHSHRYSELNTPKKSFRGHRIGVELEVEFETDEYRDDFNQKESNWFYRENDGSLGEWGCEIITIPLLPEDAKNVEFWKPLTDSINPIANSWDTGRCGLHVHIGREILGNTEDEQQSTLGKLLLVYHEFIKDTYFNRKIYGRGTGYNDHDGKTLLSSAVKELGVRILADNEVAKKVQDSVIDRSNYDRYFDINISRSATIEFRKGRGSINPSRIAMVVEYSEMLCKYAKQAVWQQLSYENFIHYLKANCKKGTSLHDMVMAHA